MKNRTFYLAIMATCGVSVPLSAATCSNQIYSTMMDVYQYAKEICLPVAQAKGKAVLDTLITHPKTVGVAAVSLAAFYYMRKASEEKKQIRRAAIDEAMQLLARDNVEEISYKVVIIGFGSSEEERVALTEVLVSDFGFNLTEAIAAIVEGQYRVVATYDSQEIACKKKDALERVGAYALVYELSLLCNELEDELENV